MSLATPWKPQPLPPPVARTTPTAPQVVECGGKRTYSDRRQARKAAGMTASHPGDGGRQLEAYKCSWCASWHIGHRPAPEAILSRRIGELRRRGGDFE